MKKQPIIIPSITTGKFVHGGQVLAEAPDGRKLFVWGALPGESVDVQLTKKKSSYLEGIAVAIHKRSPDRIEPLEPLSYLSTSPWQIMTDEAEKRAKQTILSETFQRSGVKALEWQPFYVGDEQVGYRNKQEFGFWGDDEGLHLAHFVRGTHGKQKVDGSVLARSSINKAAKVFIHHIASWVNNRQIRATDLKTVVFRSSLKGEVVAALFIKKDIDCTDLGLPEGLKGMTIFYSDPKSPASVATKQLYTIGDITLADTILGKNIMYDVCSFFQVNIPVFERSLKEMEVALQNMPCIDLYSGVGVIGVSVGAKTLIESDKANTVFAKINCHGMSIKVIQAEAEDALTHIDSGHAVIVDPPRSGLHQQVVTRLLEIKPPRIIYLSCNPITQARDIALLQSSYSVTHARGFNFFPRTPHIESLLVLERV